MINKPLNLLKLPHNLCFGFYCLNSSINSEVGRFVIFSPILVNPNSFMIAIEQSYKELGIYNENNFKTNPSKFFSYKHKCIF